MVYTEKRHIENRGENKANFAISFEDKESARKYFLELRQLFLDRNYELPESDEYRILSEKINAKLAEGVQRNA